MGQNADRDSGSPPTDLGAIALALAVFLVLAPCETFADAQPQSPAEPNPHMGALTTPFDAGIYKLRIQPPEGFPLCGMRESYSSQEWFYIPVDPQQDCAQNFSLPADWEQWPDFVVIGPYVDVPMLVNSLDDYVNQEKFFCSGASSSEQGAPRASNASTSITPAENLLLGLKTVACTREDLESGRYSNALLAYKPNPNDSGRGYMVGTYARIENMDAANRVLESVVVRLKLLD